VSTALWSLGADAAVPLPIRLLVGLLVLVVWAATMFHVGPNHHTPWRYDLPGAALTAVGWASLSLGFGWYVSIVGDGNQFVGATGAVLLGLTWLWSACVVFLIGGELNQLVAERAGVIQDGRSLYSRAVDWRRRESNGTAADDPPD
ncbi:MAG: YhjD/YihY/BrkB family envelope integrity protein, partial [Actinomycetota bacterium]